jgi:hypothetical protein
MESMYSGLSKPGTEKSDCGSQLELPCQQVTHMAMVRDKKAAVESLRKRARRMIWHICWYNLASARGEGGLGHSQPVDRQPECRLSEDRTDVGLESVMLIGREARMRVQALPFWLP